MLLLFPGPKLEAYMPCFQRSKDDAGVCSVSLGLNNGARTASNFYLRKYMTSKWYHYSIWFSDIVHFRLTCLACKGLKMMLWGLQRFSWLKQWGKNCIQFSTEENT
jgi:hypothetical protein